MSTLSLARFLFAVTAGAHFLFVSLTLGLATLVAIMETRAAANGDSVRLRMVRYWGQLYVINYAVGIVTGLLLEFQFGLVWPGLTDHAGDVFGAPLALETLVAFFVESTFLGLWIFGWHRLGRWAHVAVIWVVALTAYVSAYFILVANGFLRHPVGFLRVGDALRVDSAAKLLTNPAALLPLGHVAAGAFLVAGFFMAGVSAWHLRRGAGEELEFYRRSLRVGLISVVVAVLPALVFGALQLVFVEEPEVSVFAEVMAEVMFLAEFWMIGVGVAALVKLLSAKRLLRGRAFFRILMMTLPVPYVAMLTGWLYREDARQPWLIEGVLRTKDAVRPMSHAAMLTSTIAISALFVALTVVNIVLLRIHARRGPDATTLGREEPVESLEPVPSF